MEVSHLIASEEAARKWGPINQISTAINIKGQGTSSSSINKNTLNPHSAGLKLQLCNVKIKGHETRKKFLRVWV